MTQSISEFETTLRELALRFETVFAEGDASKVAAFYSDNAMLLPAGSDFIEGRQAIEAYWQAGIEMGLKQIKLEFVELELHGDTAIEMSRYTLSAADGSVIDQGKGVAIWKKIDGNWKMHRDIWTTSLAD